MSKPKPYDFTPYVRAGANGRVTWGTWSFTPYVARLLAHKLLDAADRIDPQRVAKAPWTKENAA